METAINRVMQKYDCATLEELEKKRQELHHHFLVVQDMVDNAIRRNDLEYANSCGIEMDKFAAQVREIEEAMQVEG